MPRRARTRPTGGRQGTRSRTACWRRRGPAGAARRFPRGPRRTMRGHRHEKPDRLRLCQASLRTGPSAAFAWPWRHLAAVSPRAGPPRATPAIRHPPQPTPAAPARVPFPLCPRPPLSHGHREHRRGAVGAAGGAGGGGGGRRPGGGGDQVDGVGRRRAGQRPREGERRHRPVPRQQRPAPPSPPSAAPWRISPLSPLSPLHSSRDPLPPRPRGSALEPTEPAPAWG